MSTGDEDDDFSVPYIAAVVTYILMVMMVLLKMMMTIVMTMMITKTTATETIYTFFPVPLLDFFLNAVMMVIRSLCSAITEQNEHGTYCGFSKYTTHRL